MTEEVGQTLCSNEVWETVSCRGIFNSTAENHIPNKLYNHNNKDIPKLLKKNIFFKDIRWGKQPVRLQFPLCVPTQRTGKQ